VPQTSKRKEGLWTGLVGLSFLISSTLPDVFSSNLPQPMRVSTKGFEMRSHGVAVEIQHPNPQLLPLYRLWSRRSLSLLLPLPCLDYRYDGTETTSLASLPISQREPDLVQGGFY
jgi:hypothetical protein